MNPTSNAQLLTRIIQPLIGRRLPAQRPTANQRQRERRRRQITATENIDKQFNTPPPSLTICLQCTPPRDTTKQQAAPAQQPNGGVF
mmetsp:Transcript_27689/g.44371  ORF Transcript_27689/g.44371 Transcript_27689/m.44371 type:complete len:87 (+) Transcript_27689:270-530(+)